MCSRGGPIGEVETLREVHRVMKPGAQLVALIPHFDPGKDAAMLREVGRKLSSPRGIRDTEHMAVFIARRG